MLERFPPSPSLKEGRNAAVKARVECKIGEGTFSIETGELAKTGRRQLSGAVRRDGRACAPPPRAAATPGQDFFPLTCDYRERVAAAGKFPGGFLKREGRPTTKEILTARLMDRPIRPSSPTGTTTKSRSMSFVLASRPAERRRRAGDERGLGRLGPLAAALPRPDRLGAAGLHRRRVRPLPHARRLGRERPGPDRLRQQEADPDDRGLRPRNARRPAWPRPSPRPTTTSARFATCRTSWPGRPARSRRNTRCPQPDHLFETLAGKYFDDFKQAKQTEGQAGPGRGLSRR